MQTSTDRLKTRDATPVAASQSTNTTKELTDEIRIGESALEALNKIVGKQTLLIEGLEKERRDFVPSENALKMIAMIVVGAEGPGLELMLNKMSKPLITAFTEAIHSDFDKYARLAEPVIGVHSIKTIRETAERIAALLTEDCICAIEVPYFASLIYAHCFIANEEDLAERINYSRGYRDGREKSARIVRKKVSDAKKQLQEDSNPLRETEKALTEEKRRNC